MCSKVASAHQAKRPHRHCSEIISFESWQRCLLC